MSKERACKPEIGGIVGGSLYNYGGGLSVLVMGWERSKN